MKQETKPVPETAMTPAEALFSAFFRAEKIYCYRSAALPVEEKLLTAPRRLPDWAKGVVIFLVPYFVRDDARRNISRYAVPQDYHIYASMLSERLNAALSAESVSVRAKIFSDTSPFDERALAVRTRLGFPGKNGLLIHETYGSYVFLAEAVTSCVLRLSGGADSTREACLGCGACGAACPAGCLSENAPHRMCLSALTQKKHVSEEEMRLIASHALAWGCDRCQEVCPHNRNAAETPIPFFRENRLPYLTRKTVEEMSDEAFSRRAYAWRGREVILRNLALRGE